MSDEVTLQLATAEDLPRLANLLELYIHDLSVLFAVDVGPDGRFGYPALERYVREPQARFAYLIRAGSQLAGFALAQRGSPMTDDPSDLDVAEFFVLRRHRRAGVGQRAARLLWERTRGHWIVRVAADNLPARAFWRATIAAYSGAPLSERQVERPGRDWQVLDFWS
jgi:predicted acetyltransferase